MIQNCQICGSSNWELYREGKIRTGRFGKYSQTPHPVFLCLSCGAARLEGATIDYENEDYRQMVDGGSSSSHFYELHDGEQAEKVSILGTKDLWNMVIADIGCGGGSFIELLKNYAARTLAIVPTESFSDTLCSKGPDWYPYAPDTRVENRGTVDSATCFSVIEHVEEPRKLLEDILSLLTPNGRLLISTPNRNDWMIPLLPEDYGTFFYRQVHRWYFDSGSLASLGEIAGFSRVNTFYHHRFDFSNLIGWLRDRKPTGTGKISVPDGVDAAYKASLEYSGKADYLYAWMEK